MLAILGLEDNAYGVTIRDEIGRATGHVRTLGSIYKSLERLEQKRLVSSRIGDPLGVRGGRRRTYYSFRAEGAAALEQSLNGLRTLSQELEPRWRLG